MCCEGFHGLGFPGSVARFSVYVWGLLAKTERMDKGTLVVGDSGTLGGSGLRVLWLEFRASAPKPQTHQP